MDFGYVFRLGKVRADLDERRTAFENGPDVERAEALRGTLEDAQLVLSDLLDDDDLWDFASREVSRDTEHVFGPLDAYVTSLPGLLTLFGYREPPPPSAERLVTGSLSLLRGPSASVDEIETAKENLRDLVARLGALRREDPPWKLAHIASETGIAVEAMTSIAAGGALTAITLTVGGVIATVSGGVIPVAAVFVVGGARRWNKARDIRRDADALAAGQDFLDVNLLRAARSAVEIHLSEIRESWDDPGAASSVQDHLESLRDIARRFKLNAGELTAKINQANIRQPGRGDIIGKIRDIIVATYSIADGARHVVVRTGRIDGTSRAQLESLLTTLQALPRP
jgi:hypothetical protein